MRNLTLVGLSDDGAQVVFVDDAGTEFAAPADHTLREALRGPRPRQAQLEIEMDSALRPRDIQARIRSGETPEAVAVLAQVTVDKIMPFCVPVLAERQHVADQAQRSHVRRKNAEGPSRRLRDVVGERLRGRGVDAGPAEWDAWRRDDGLWSVQLTYRSGERERSALFAYDAIGRYSVAEDDEAKWLTGEKQSTRKGPQPREAGRNERRLSAVPNGEGDDLFVAADGDDDPTDDLTAMVHAVREGSDAPEATTDEETGEATDRAEAPSDDVHSGPEDVSAPEFGGAEPEPAARPAEHQVEEAPRRKRRGKRASVPSWDEIMFGKGTDE